MKKQDLQERIKIANANNEVIKCQYQSKKLMEDYIKNNIFIGEVITLADYEDYDIEPLVLTDGHVVDMIIGCKNDVRVDTMDLSTMDFEEVRRVYNTFTDIQEIDGTDGDDDEEEEDEVDYDEHRIIDTPSGEVMLKACFDCDRDEDYLCAYIGDNFDEFVCEIEGLTLYDDEEDLVDAVMEHLY